jgi:oxygen-independent coproporphyrinogen III oxidase
LAGIYIHIPFCKKACFYCDFHFDVSFKHKDDVLHAMHTELAQRVSFFDKDEEIQSIYFGGGTPSVLSKDELASIMDALQSNYNIATHAEITYECNPDDLSLTYLRQIKSLGVNRLSIGVQSFNDKHLKWMNRSHNSEQSLQCVDMAANVGFTDISIDLIYGVPSLKSMEWQDTVERALALPINHLSAYGLTLEPNTPYQRLVDQKKYETPREGVAAKHFKALVKTIKENGWDHYEVSNFCKSGNYSKHNTAYWQNKKYLGLGPSAHSFSGSHRLWNVSNNADYVTKISTGQPYYDSEILTNEDRINESLLTGLRTKWGVQVAELKEKYNYDVMNLYSNNINEWQEKGWVTTGQNELKLTSTGLLFADYIASELFKLKD